MGPRHWLSSVVNLVIQTDVTQNLEFHLALSTASSQFTQPAVLEPSKLVLFRPTHINQRKIV